MQICGFCSLQLRQQYYSRISSTIIATLDDFMFFSLYCIPIITRSTTSGTSCQQYCTAVQELLACKKRAKRVQRARGRVQSAIPFEGQFFDSQLQSARVSRACEETCITRIFHTLHSDGAAILFVFLFLSLYHTEITKASIIRISHFVVSDYVFYNTTYEKSYM